MIFGVCIGDGERFNVIAGPSIEKHRAAEDHVLVDDGRSGICAAYNRFIAVARSAPQCEALILMHDDVELVDPRFGDKIHALFGSGQRGIVGVIGGRGLTNPVWWQARATVGRVAEHERIHVGSRLVGPVDVLDGLFLALGPSAFNRLSFDNINLPRFHGYDANICLEARRLDIPVEVADIAVRHAPKGGYGDHAEFERAMSHIRRTYGEFMVPLTYTERLLRRARRLAWRLLVKLRDAVAAARRVGGLVDRA